MSRKRDSTSGHSLTLKEKVYYLLERYHDTKAKTLCQLLSINYKHQGGYVRKLRYQWKRDFKNGLRSLSPTLFKQHHARAFCYVPKTVSRAAALSLGWTQSKNQNRVLVFKDNSYGRIEWWETHRCLVHINKPQTMGRVKQFLSNVFFRSGLIFDIKMFSHFIESVQWFGAHDVYESSETVPYAVISTYKDTLGFVFKAGDLSHPNSYEFEWCKPSWMERFELLSRQALVNLDIDSKALQQTSQAIGQFNEFMKDLTAPKMVSGKDPSVV